MSIKTLNVKKLLLLTVLCRKNIVGLKSYYEYYLLYCSEFIIPSIV